MVVARASSSGVAICYVVPVIWMAPCLHIKDKNNRREKKTYAQSDTTEGNADLTLQRTLKLTHPGTVAEFDICDCLAGRVNV